MKPRARTYFHILLAILLLQPWTGYAMVVDPHSQPEHTIRIIENKGQWEPNVLFKAAIPGGYLFITRQGLAYALYDEKALHEMDHDGKTDGIINGHNVFVDFVQPSLTSTVSTEAASPEYYNYFIGNNAGKWAHHCHAYEKITLHNVYDHIDLEIIALDESFKMNFIVHPGGNPAQVKLKYRGADALNIYNGALNIATSTGVLKEEKPICLQDGNTIPSGFVLSGDVLSYQLSAYNKKADLLIDPTVIFGSFSGSTADNWGFTATFDKDGNAFGGGTVYGVGYPVKAGSYQVAYKGGVTVRGEEIARDAGIMKFSPDGKQLLFATYLGGTHNEQPHSLICNDLGDIIIMGTTKSADFPTSATAFDRSHNGLYDIFITKLTGDGANLLNSTFLGGDKDDGLNNDGTNGRYDATQRPLTYNYGDMFRGEVMVDESGAVYVASTTRSSTDDHFPIVNGCQVSYGGGNQDGCLVKLKEDLSGIVFSTYIGGNGSDAVYGIGFDNSDNIFICGGTSSNNIGATGGPQFNYHGGTDGFVARLSPAGNVLEAFLYIGTSAYDQTYFIQMQPDRQQVYLTGQTSGLFPVSAGVYSNTKGKQYIAILDRNLTTIKASTVFGTGGSVPDISPSAFLVDVCGRIYVSGWGGDVNNGFNNQTGSTSGLPLTSNAFQKTTDGSDFYLIVFGKDLKTLAYATYFGGAISAEHVDGGTSRFDKNGTVYQSVCGGCGGSSDFPTTPGAYSRSNRSRNCNNLVFKVTLNVSETAPVFKDTLIKVYATDPLVFPFKITDADGDSVFFTYSGDIFTSVTNPATIVKHEGPGTSTGTLTWQTVCADLTYDTLEVQLNMTDNGCPVVRTGTGTIRILVLPAPPVPPPFPECLKTINDNTVKLDWKNSMPPRYFKSYEVYRSKNNEPFTLLSTVSNAGISSFTDTSAMLHVINNYCYFITTTNICDSLGDTSRIICSLFRSDTSTTPVFRFTKDTTVKVFAFDTLDYTTVIEAIDPKDSVYIQVEGTMLGNANLLSHKLENKLSKATLHVQWIAKCEGLNAADTPYLHFYVKDNQCPSPRTSNGIVRIVVIPPPQNMPPALSCIKYIDDRTVEVKWKKAPVNKYFSRFILLRRDETGMVKPCRDVNNADAYETLDTVLHSLVRNFCYAITSQDICGYFGDTCPYKCTVRQPEDFPAAPAFYTVTVKDNKNIAVFWRSSAEEDFAAYQLFRYPLLHPGQEAKYYESANREDSVFLDEAVKVQEQSYCYRIVQVNDCGLQSPQGPEACTILLKGHSQPFEHTLKWNDYHYWKTGMRNYDVVRIQPGLDAERIAEQYAGDTQSMDLHLNHRNGLYRYQVIANESDKGFGYTSVSNEIELIQAPLLHVPNAFTPNTDGINETWNVRPVFVKDYSLQLYDRWGRLVFETHDPYEQFNGVVQNGNDATSDVFVYLIQYTGWDASSHQAKGNLTILR